VPTLDTGTARQHIARSPVVRLATVGADGKPHIVTTTFAIHGDLIYMAVDHKPKRSRNLKRLDNIRANPQVAVLADHYEDDWEQLWWVRGDGQAHIVEDPSGMALPVDLLVDRYQQYREHRPEGPVIVIKIERWSGWSYSEGTSIT
jgi:PPOX class probable F420-dependent enzyme